MRILEETRVYMCSIGKRRKWVESSTRCYFRWGGVISKVVTLGKDLK